MIIRFGLLAHSITAYEWTIWVPGSGRRGRNPTSGSLGGAPAPDAPLEVTMPAYRVVFLTAAGLALAAALFSLGRYRTEAPAVLAAALE